MCYVAYILISLSLVCSFLFCSKTLLQSLRDPEQSSTIGASVVLKFFIQQKGAELFHAIPDLVKDSLLALQLCDVPRAKSGVLKALVALTKHHPKLVCAEMLQQSLPYDEHLVEYWHLVCNDPELTGLMLDNFLQLLSGACLYEQSDGTSATATSSDRQRLASVPPFAIFCALHEMMPCKDIHDVSSQTHKGKCATLTSISCSNWSHVLRTCSPCCLPRSPATPIWLHPCPRLCPLAVRHSRANRRRVNSVLCPTRSWSS